MRLTEALHYYNMAKAPSESWIRARFTHFAPTPEDAKAREAYQKRLQERRERRGRKIMRVFE